MIWSAASVIAWLADAHARLTVYASHPLDNIGSSETSRALFGATTYGTAVPYTIAATKSPSRFVRCTNSATHRFPSSIADMSLKAVPARANGVRTPAMIATRRPGAPSGDMG